MHITLHQYLTPGFILYQTPRHFIFQTQQKTIPHASILSMDRLTASCEEITQKAFFDLLKQQKPISQQQIWAIYGIVVVQETPFLAIVNQAILVTSSRQTPVYQLKDLVFIRFEPEEEKSLPIQQKKVLDFISTQLVADKFYFSYTEDLTVSFKKKLKHSPNQIKPDPKYFWNQSNTQFLHLNNISSPWLIPIIQGYVGSIQQHSLEYRIIARRSKYMSGTRYNNRGVNHEGFASNFVEIQERIQCQGRIFSFLEFRGSVPVFWKEEGGFYTIEFQHGEEKCLKGLKKHYDNLTDEYQCTINTINLLSELKERQKTLSQRFVKLLSQYGSKTYFSFDFNLNPQTLHQNIETFIESYSYKQSNNNFECYDLKDQNYAYQQHFIPRVNCLDCIDRTNVICCRIGEEFVRKVFQQVGVSWSQEFCQKYLAHWKHLGNQISLIYCGTASVAQHITVKQQPTYISTLTSSFRSVTRFFNASQSDQLKEQCNLYLLRQHPKSITTFFGNNIAQLHINKSDYCQFSDVDVCVVTWNVAAIEPEQLTQSDQAIFAQHIFGQNYDKAPGLIFVTLQQIVELNTYNVVSNDNSSQKKRWQSNFLSILKQHNPNNAGFTYSLYFSQALVGITSFLFVKSSLNHKLDILYRIKKVFSYGVKRGYGGSLGNKGSIVSGFVIHNTLIVNFASHLAAGDDKRDNRMEDVRAVIVSLKEDQSAAKYVKFCDVMFFTGDLNFRLNATDQQVRSVLDQAKNISLKDNFHKSNLLEQLLLKDQFYQTNKKQKCLKNFIQHPITFFPTYRYVKQTSDHDLKRKPAWCDRIFFYTKDKYSLKCEKYHAIDEVNKSDHKPVVGWFSLKVKQENKEKKQKLVEDWLAEGRKNETIIQSPLYNFPKTRYNYE